VRARWPARNANILRKATIFSAQQGKKLDDPRGQEGPRLAEKAGFNLMAEY